MAIRSPFDLFAWTITRLPLLALLIAVAWVLMAGLEQLEIITPGTEFFVGNHETDNRIAPLGGMTTEEALIASLDSGDPEQMQATLDQLEAQQRALASHSLANR